MIRLIPKYKNIPLYRSFAWKLIWQRITRGYDESITWDLYYHVAKYVLPRLTLFYDSMDKHRTIPYDYEQYYINKYIKMGYKYNTRWARLDDKEIARKAFEEAYDHWKDDVFKMMEAFRDIINEEDYYDRWVKEHTASVKLAQSKLDQLKIQKERKEYWDSFGFEEEYTPSSKFTVYHFSNQKRKIGLKLFSEHFQSLWL